MEKSCSYCVHCSSYLEDDLCLSCIEADDLVFWEMKTWWEEILSI